MIKHDKSEKNTLAGFYNISSFNEAEELGSKYVLETVLTALRYLLIF